jgi:DNA-nicking Smr family endonuclease
MESQFSEPFRLPLGTVLDLHTFRPEDASSVIEAFIQEAIDNGNVHLRIIHGKGTGAMKELTEKVLRAHPDVVSFGSANDASGWGATLVNLRCVHG